MREATHSSGISCSVSISNGSVNSLSATVVDSSWSFEIWGSTMVVLYMQKQRQFLARSLHACTALRWLVCFVGPIFPLLFPWWTVVGSSTASWVGVLGDVLIWVQFGSSILGSSIRLTENTFSVVVGRWWWLAQSIVILSKYYLL